MAKKGQTFQKYPLELKMEAVRLVTKENVSLREAARQLGIRNKTQVLSWVRKHQNDEPMEATAFRKGRPKTKFASMEEEMAYLKAEIEYLKKQYPNLHRE